MATKTQLIQQCTKNLGETLPRGSKTRVVDFLRRQPLRTLKDWADNHEELRQQVKKYLHVVMGCGQQR